MLADRTCGSTWHCRIITRRPKFTSI